MKCNILIICDVAENSSSIKNIISKIEDYSIKLLGIQSKEELRQHEEELRDSDLLVLDIENNGVQCLKYIREDLTFKKLPVVFLSTKRDKDTIQKVYSVGRIDFICKPYETYELLYRIKEQFNIREIYEKSKLKNSLLELIGEKLVEKNTILETSLDILVHDTKNQFMNIQFNLTQELENDMRSVLKEQIDNLYNLIMEAAGYLNSKKRIFSLYEIITGIHLTKKRIPILKHEQINLECISRAELFIESSIMIKNAVTNLLENALKYSPEGSEINLKLQRVGKRIYIHIADRGTGIPDSEKQKIFRKHYRREETIEIEGTGWGLWITHSIVKKEGGMVYVSDNPGGGSIFTIELPAFIIKDPDKGIKDLSGWFEIPEGIIRKKETTIRNMLRLQKDEEYEDFNTCVFTSLLMHYRNERTQKNKAVVHKRLEALKKLNPDAKKALIVDDSIYVHYYMAKYLTDLGFRILNYAKNGREGVNYYKEYKPDLVTMDYTMPVLSGLDAANEIFDFDKNAHILFVTAAGELPAFRSRIDGRLPKENIRVIIKPVKKEQIKSVLSNFI